MEIKTKFNVGDIVWGFYKKPIKMIVKKISVAVSRNRYDDNYSCRIDYRSEVSGEEHSGSLWSEESLYVSAEDCVRANMDECLNALNEKEIDE